MAYTEAQKAACKRWYEKNKDKKNSARRGTRAEEHRKYYEVNKEAILKRTKEYAKANRKAVNEASRRYKQRHPERKLLSSAKSRAIKKGILFNLIPEDIKIPEVCPLLGIPITTDRNPDTSPSLDRIDNTKGYTKDNIWIISFKANRMKNTATKEELISFAENLLKLKEFL